MKIDGNEKEKQAMAAFHRGDRAEGFKLQEEYASAFREEYKDKDHCSCHRACRYHGNCKECVAIHRAHEEHVPNCMRPMLRIRPFSFRVADTPWFNMAGNEQCRNSEACYAAALLI